MKHMEEHVFSSYGKEETQSDISSTDLDLSMEQSEYDVLKDESHCQLLDRQSRSSSILSQGQSSEGDTITSLNRVNKHGRVVLRSISSESSISTGRARPLPITITHLEPKNQKKHAFTVCNYGSADISSIPASPESVFSPDVSHFPFDKEYKGQYSRRSSFFSPSSYPASISSGSRFGTVNSNSKNEYDITIQNTINMNVYDACDNNNTIKGNDVIVDVSDNVDNSKEKETFSSLNKNKNYQFFDVIKRGRVFAKRKKDRLVLKNGEVNVSFTNVRKRGLKFFQDIFTTLLDAKWRYLVLVFVLAFLLTWLGFALLWWLMATYETNIVSSNYNATSESPSRCLIGVYNFASAVLFSIETQHTIGYGTRAVTPECPLAIVLVMLQSLIGVILSCLTTGLIFAKFARPKRRAETILFSKRAVICERNGKRCLMFRVGDMRKSPMISVNIRAILVDECITKEGEVVRFHQHNLHIQSEAEDFFFLAWPIRAIHYIDESSPLWELSEEKLLGSNFEIVVVFEGTNSSTGQTTQVRTSYLPAEILWGQKLETLLTHQSESGQFIVDYSQFHETSNLYIGENSANDKVSDLES